jgi:enoyl-CoA hydratase/carnithine racemase
MVDVRPVRDVDHSDHVLFPSQDLLPAGGAGNDLVGGAIARELVLTGREIDAAEALRLHLVSELTKPGELTDRALELARQIARAPREILVRHKAKFTARSTISPQTLTLDL